MLMITEKITIHNNGDGMDDALNLTQHVADSLSLGRKETFHLRLLAEEMLGVVRAITADFNASFWLEENGRVCKLHLEAKSTLDYQKRRELLSVSTSGKNIANVGFMDKIRTLIEAGLQGIDDSFKLQSQYGVGMFNYGAVNIMDSAMADALYSWSMQKYKSEIDAVRSEESEAWDELEKSIIANIADEVSVGVTKDSVELIVQKKF